MAEIIPIAKKIESVRDMFETRKGELAKLLPQHIPADRLVRCAIDAIITNPKLLDCTKISLYGALLECASLGLEPGVAGQCWIIPYGQKATFIPGYRGLAQLAYRSLKVQGIMARVVYAKDRFSYKMFPPELEHEAERSSDRGERVAAYSAVMMDGMWFWHVMEAHEIERIKRRSAAAQKKESPWNHPEDESEMWKKTVFKQHAKLLPMSVEDRSLARAIQLADQAESGLDQHLEVAEVEEST